ncbi:MAG: site-specific integrase [Bacteriovorax sp.]|nr:site-specific integrase [Bacteriovorax sp.]
MGIKSYRKDEKVFWKVYVNLRSKENPALRAQRNFSGIESKAAALRIEKQLIAEASKDLGIQSGLGMPWKTLFEKWEKDSYAGLGRNLSVTTIQDISTTVKKWTMSWMDKPADELTRADGKEIIKAMELQNLSYRAKQKIRSFINAIFTYGIEERYIRKPIPSPFTGLELKKTEEKVPEILTLTEIKKFLDLAKQIQSPWYPIWATALLTGMRNGELYALEWDDIDFENLLIRVSKSYNSRLNSVKSTKAGYWRNVPISNELKSIFIELKLNLESRPDNEQRFVLPRSWYWDKGLQARELRTFLINNGLPSVKFHALRACFATQLLSKNVPPAIVMKICGWKNLKTMEFYVRLAGVNESGATEVLNILPTEREVMDNVVNLFSR